MPTWILVSLLVACPKPEETDTDETDLCACDAVVDVCDAVADASSDECACDPDCAEPANGACAADTHCDTYCDPGGVCVDPDCGSDGGCVP